MYNRLRTAELFLLTAALFITGCSPYPLLRRHMAPAELKKEILLLDFRKTGVLVTAVFHFESRRHLSYALCRFPAAGYPVRTENNTLPHPQIRNFSAYDGTIRLPLQKKKITYEFPVRFRKKTRIRISYTAPYQMRKGKREFRYILRSGGWWPGGIGQLKIILRNRSGKKIRINSPYRTGRIFSNFLPERDLVAALF